MGIEELISWYQKKIGTYDKQQWEKTVEQRIIHGLTHIQLKTAKPKTDLIDLDLVRGSSFTKAKPKHGFITVARLSTLRFLFLPIYSKWWVQQTSGKIFGLLLLLYLLQLINLAIYSYNTQNIAENSSQHVPTSELIVPIMMMWVLSFILSQIVATSSGSESLKTKPKFRKNYRRVRRSRKLILEKAVESSETICIDGRNSRRSGIRNNWKSKDNLVKNTKNKNVLFEENVNIAENSNTNPKINIKGARRIFKRQPLDDDGFESLNGNGSSPSDNGEDPVIPTKASLEVKNAAEKDGSNTSGLRCNEWVKSVLGTREVLTLNRRQSAPDLLPPRIDELDTDSDTFTHNTLKVPILKDIRSSKSCSVNKLHFESTCETDEEGECETISSPETIGSGAIEANTSATEWIGVTTNSEDCSYSSDLSESDAHIDNLDIDAPPTYILSHNCGPSDRVSCTIWDSREIKKADLSVIEISSVIIARVETMPESRDYFYLGVIIAFLLAILPILCRLCTTIIDSTNVDEVQITLIQLTNMVFDKFSESFCKIFDAMLGAQTWVRTLTIIAATQRWILGFFLFFLMAVAERTFKQRFLYAKLFSHLTSSRRARKSELPHFRLHKVRNIKTWLSVRSYLKKRGPQRSVDVIVSATFISMLLLLSFVCMELIKESFTLNSQYNLEMLIWIFGLGIFIMRYMTLGVKINKKYRNLSVLITEQINLYLQIEQKPHKKEELMVANSVLKLAADLLKELESQFKILGLSANPFLYNITKVVILSALSGILSELLGFKLKLHKISIK